MKKLFTFLVAMMASVGTIMAETYSGTCGIEGDNLMWEINTEDSTFTISGSGAMPDYEVYYDGSTAPWSGYRLFIKTMNLSNGLTNIGNYALHGAKNLVSVHLPENITYIGSHSFYGNDKINTVTMCNNVREIRNSAFYGCSNLLNLTLSSNLLYIRGFAFANCSELRDFVIPQSVISIGENVFENTGFYNDFWANVPASARGRLYKDNCLIKVSWNFEGGQFLIEAGTRVIAGMAVQNQNMSAVVIPSSVKGIGPNAFSNCTALSKVTIPGSVKTIENRAFFSCTGLDTLILQEEVEEIGKSAFSDCIGLTHVKLPSSLKRIEDNAFSIYTSSYIQSGASKLQIIDIPDSVTYIGNNAFEYCRNLQSVKLGKSVDTIGNQAFYECNAIKSISMQEGIRYIGIEAFYDCYNIEDIQFPQSLEYIGRQAFIGSSQITTIEIPKNVQTIEGSQGGGAFGACWKLDTIVWNATHCSDFRFLYYEPSVSDAPFYHYYAETEKQIKSFTFGAEVEYIPSYLCNGMENVHEFIIPESVKAIGIGAFQSCKGIKSISIPQNVDSIAELVFAYSDSLTSLYNYALTPQVIKESVFYNIDKSSCTLYVPEESIDLYKTAKIWKDFSNIVAIEKAPTAIDEINSSANIGDSRKILRDGQILILRGEKVYTIQGQEVK